MSGRRAKALRKEFYQLHHREPKTTETRRKSFMGWFTQRRRVRAKDGSLKTETGQKARPVVLVTDSVSEWRRFKRAWASR